MSVEVRQSDRERAHDVTLRNLVAASGQEMPWMREALAPLLAGQEDDHYMVQAFAAHRHQAEEAIIRAADKWLATQYGLRPLSADLAAIRSIDTRGE